MSDLSTHKVNGAPARIVGQPQSTPTVPAVGNIRVYSKPSDGSDTYAAIEPIIIRVRFNEIVTLKGLLTINFDSGTEELIASSRGPATSVRNIYLHGRVSATVSDTDGISIDANSLRLRTGATVTKGSDSSVDANLNHSAVSANSGHKVDHTKILHVSKPKIASMEFIEGPEDGLAYRAGETIQISVWFDSAVKRKTGGKRDFSLAIKVGDKTRQAYSEDIDANVFWFEYTVSADDLDADGVSVPTNPFTLASGATLELRVAAIPVNLSYEGLADHWKQRVNGSGKAGLVGPLGPAMKFVWVNGKQKISESGSDNSTSLYVLMDSAGTVDTELTLEVSRAASGNTASLSSDTLTISAGSTRSNTITVTATNNDKRSRTDPHTVKITATVSENDEDDVKPPPPAYLYIDDDDNN